jgi:hypothetical protein
MDGDLSTPPSAPLAPEGGDEGVLAALDRMVVEDPHPVAEIFEERNSPRHRTTTISGSPPR